MPEHHSYVEPFFGSGAVLFNKKPSNIETANDLDNKVCTLFKVIRERPEELARAIELTPFARHEYYQTFNTELPENDIELSRKFLVQCWQGHGFRTNGHKVGWKNDVQGREKAYAVSNWYRLPDWIMQVTDRLKAVQIENRPAIDVIKRFRYRNVLIYADPPYVLETRTGKQYKYEMSTQDHIDLLEELMQHPGPVIISGYQSELYSDILKGWKTATITSNAEYYNGKSRTEVLWTNYDSPAEQLSMYE